MVEARSSQREATGAFSAPDALGQAALARLRQAARETVGPLDAWDAELAFALNGAVELQGPSDAPYHNLEHSLNAALAAADILRGVAVARTVDAAEWTHIVVALLLHDMGYVRGACSEDRAGTFVISEEGARFQPRRGATDGALGPYHVVRSMIHARERLAERPRMDVERLVAAIGCTQFPPCDEAPIDPASEGGLVRASDLISQLGDPRYVPRMSALFAEFRETGYADTVGLASAADLVDCMADFHRHEAAPLIGPALSHLSKSVDGRGWLARIEANLALAARETRMVGPCRGPIRTQAGD